MFLPNIFGLVERLVNTAFLVPWTSFLLPNIGWFLAVTTVLDRAMDRQSLSLQNQESSFDYIIGE